MVVHQIPIADFTIGAEQLVLIAGPCVIESYPHLLKIAAAIKDITTKLNMPYILKSSYDKANRTALSGFRGRGLETGLQILAHVKRELAVPVLTDIHDPAQIPLAVEVADIIQVPAFLSRQTDLLLAAGRSGKPVNVKKGQFMAPWDIRKTIEKIESVDNQRILITERGVSFGYNNLVVDMRSLAIMRTFGYPVVFDATHSVQLPSGQGTSSGGQREFVAPLARAAVAVGVDVLFLEVHDEPDCAPCDGPNMIALTDLEPLLRSVLALDAVRRQHHG